MGFFIRVVNSAFLQGNQFSLGFGVSCEEALCGYLGLKDCTARPLVLPFHMCSVGCSQRNRVETEAWEKPLPPSCVFITLLIPKAGQSQESLLLDISLCWWAAGQGMCSTGPVWMELPVLGCLCCVWSWNRQVELLSAWRVSPKLMVNGEKKERTEGNQMCSQTQIHHFTYLVSPHCWSGSALGSIWVVWSQQKEEFP